ncbi:MAG: hypothetical protein HY540_05635 [Deltaproteobacteria bacterium]|nr:hypothetical protein [Deltaproteobacteria bacterium]
MADDVLINKAAIIERTLRRIEEEYADDPKNLKDFLDFAKLALKEAKKKV